MACVRSGISGWVIGLLIVGVRAPNGARPIPGRPGRRCWPTARPPLFSVWDLEIGGGGALRQQPLATGWPEGSLRMCSHAVGFWHRPTRDRSLKSSSERGPRSASDGRFLAHARAAPRPALSIRRRRRGAIGSAAARPDRKRWPRGSVACVRSGISGWVIGLLIVGVRAPNGARRIPGRPGRRCWPTARPPLLSCLALGDRRWRSPSATAARNRLAAGKPSDVLARCWILASADRDRSLNLHLKGGRVPPLMVVSSRTRGRPLGQRFRSGGAGAELSGRPRHDPIESAGRGGLWRVCAPAFQAG